MHYTFFSGTERLKPEARRRVGDAVLRTGRDTISAIDVCAGTEITANVPFYHEKWHARMHRSVYVTAINTLLGAPAVSSSDVSWTMDDAMRAASSAHTSFTRTFVAHRRPVQTRQYMSCEEWADVNLAILTRVFSAPRFMWHGTCATDDAWVARRCIVDGVPGWAVLNSSVSTQLVLAAGALLRHVLEQELTHVTRQKQSGAPFARGGYFVVVDSDVQHVPEKHWVRRELRENNDVLCALRNELMRRASQ